MSKVISQLLAPIQYDVKTAQEQLSKLVKEYDADGKVFAENGYYFCTSNLLKGVRTIQSTENIYHNQQLDMVLFKLLNTLVQQLDEDAEKSAATRAILEGEYKFHLMPKPDYFLPIMKILLQACKGDKILGELIYQIKVQCDPTKMTDHTGKNFPRIVIYSSLGKQNADLLLTKLKEVFAQYDINKISEDITPRFSTKINALIYYTQGSGDLKNIILKEGNEILLTDSQVHYSWGEQRLEKATISPKAKVKANLKN